MRALLLLLFFVTAACVPQEAAAPPPEVTNAVGPLPSALPSIVSAASSVTPTPIQTATLTPSPAARSTAASGTPASNTPVATRTTPPPPPTPAPTPPPAQAPTAAPTPNVFIDKSQTYPTYDGSQVEIRGVIVNQGPALTGVWLEGRIYDGPNGKVIATGRTDIGALGAGVSQKFSLLISNIPGLRQVYYQVIIHLG